ncbi:adenylate/guanylate cyclase domain-containing protein [candidate division KSB1 bacterium]|nr:adenylate/guanylate cyclase domain-containing protein [candidate division KSB1 bacterium]
MTITDPELINAFQMREMMVERRLNILRAYIAVFFIVLDIIMTWLSGKYSIHLSILFSSLAIVFTIYFCLVQYISSGKHYFGWLKYITVTVDYLFILGLFVEYRTTTFFLNMPREVVVFHFIAFIIFVNLLSVARYSRTVILYSTFLGVLSGGYLLIRYIPVSWSTWFTTLMILFSGLITYMFSTDINNLFLKLRQREKLNRFLSKEIIQSIDSGQLELKLGGEKKHVTVLFADIRNFTQISERHDAFEIVDFLNEYFSMMTSIIFKHGGIVDKFIGDALMAVFGAPISKPDDALRAVSAGIEMQTYLQRMKINRLDDSKPLLNVGIAIHSGIVVAGNIGSTERMDYTVIGDTVNLASRIEGLNKLYHTDMLISESTYQEVKDKFEMQFISETTVRGKTKPIRLYTIPTLTLQSEYEHAHSAVNSFVDVAYLLDVNSKIISK